MRVVDLSELIRLWGEPPNQPPATQQNATPQDGDTQQAMLRALEAMHRELVALRQEVAELKRLPAPQPPEKPPQGEQEPTPTNDDPHGLRALVRAMRGTEP